MLFRLLSRRFPLPIIGCRDLVALSHHSYCTKGGTVSHQKEVCDTPEVREYLTQVIWMKTIPAEVPDCNILRDVAYSFYCYVKIMFR